MKKSRSALPLFAASCLILNVAVSNYAATGADKLTKSFKNVIVMIPDGCGIAHTTLSRWYTASPLACDALHVAQMRTYCSNSYITDSAPAATAFATGYKSFDKMIGVLPGSYTMPGTQFPVGSENSPVATVLEGARVNGRATGIVATSTTSHATPADYTSHWYARSNESIIMEQQVYQGVDVLFGGGKKHILTTTNGGIRNDNENLMDTLVNMGYSIVNNKNELASISDTAGKVWGQFTVDAMARDMGRKNIPELNAQPSLAQMADKAIRLLSNSAKGKENGFFLMVEGSQVDWASHANDPIGVIGEYLAFDSAVTVALNFAKSSGNTLLIVMSDHDNGGLSLGNSRTDATYSSRPLDSLLTAPVKKATLDGASVETYLGANRTNTSAIQAAVSQFFGISDLSGDELTAIAASKEGSMEYTLGPIMSKRTDIGWTTTGHTGNDLPLYYYGTDDHFNTMENSDVAWICAKAMSVDLGITNRVLFNKASILFDGMTLTVDTAGVNSGNGSLTVVSNGKSAVLPFNKNEIIVDGQKYRMNGLTIYSFKNNTVYVPQQAKELFTGESIGNARSLLKKSIVPKETFYELFDMQGKIVASTRATDYRHAFAKKAFANGNYIIRSNKKMVEKINIHNRAISVSSFVK